MFREKSGGIRRILCLALCLVMLLSLCACGSPMAIENLYDISDELLEQMGYDPAEIERQAPIDKKLRNAIDALPQGSKDETWAVYIYMNGSDLESQGRDHLSDLTKAMIAPINEDFSAQQALRARENVMAISQAISTSGSSFPKVLTMPNYENNLDLSAEIAPESEGGSGEEEPTLYTGIANVYLRELMQCSFGDNIDVVVQPGGTKAWGMTEINPNTTRRFEIGNGRLNQVYEGPLQNMGKPETLSEFLKFCQENYPADNTMVILWDHGGAYRGFGWDEIFANDCLTINELREGFSGAYDLDEDEPPIDLLYMNACLMSNTDVYNQLRGTAKYMLGHEEVGWAGFDFYRTPFELLCENPGMNPAQLAAGIVDSFFRNTGIIYLLTGQVMATNMVVSDLSKAAQVYDAYAEFAKAALEAAIKDPAILTELTRGAKASILFAQSAYKGYNTIDLKSFMENVEELFPKEAKAVIKAIDEAILYHRGNSYLAGAGGVSVYYPCNIDTYGGLKVFLDYVYDISDNQDINSLYYYKVAGCLDNELGDYVSQQGYGTAKTLDFSPFNQFKTLPLTEKKDNKIFVSPGKDIYKYTADMYLQLAAMDEESGSLTYLGQDRYVYSQGIREIYAQLKGNWVTLDGVHLPVEIAESTDEYVKYQSRVMHNGQERFLILRYIRDSKTTEILGLREHDNVADTMGRNIIPLSVGDKIQPIYISSLTNGSFVSTSPGESIKYSEDSSISDAPLSDGTYWARIVLEDLRSDRYYSQIIQFSVKGGQVKDIELAPIGAMADILY